jgi:hypothetical protein
MVDDLHKARMRLRDAFALTAEREAELGRDGFLELPERIQQELSVLQAQSIPKEYAKDAILGAEHNLARYNARLDDAFNLVAQLAGEAGRQRARRSKQGVKLAIGGAAAAAALGGGMFWYLGRLASESAACAAVDGCRVLGQCSAVLRTEGSIGFDCRALDADCKGATVCQREGACTAEGGKCVAATDDDCRGTERCRLEGWCKAVDQRCVAAAADDCRRTAACDERGACSPVGGVCAAGSDFDCRQSLVCKRDGACLEVDHACVQPPDWEPDAGAPTKAMPGKARKRTLRR